MTTTNKLIDAYIRFAEAFHETLQEAEELYQQGGDGIQQALAAFDEDRLQIQEATEQLMSLADKDALAARLLVGYPLAGASILQLRQAAQERVDLGERALAAAQRLGDRQAEGMLLGSIGVAHYNLGDYEKAQDYHERALAISRECEDRRSEGSRLNDLGTVHRERGKLEDAVSCYEQALVITRNVGDKATEEACLGNLGIVYTTMGQPEQASSYYEQAVKIAQDTGNLVGQRRHLSNLGSVYQTTGQISEATSYYEQALRISQQLNDQRGMSNNLATLAMAKRAEGRIEEAIQDFQESLNIAEEINNPLGVARQRDNLAEIYFAVHRVQEAVADGEAAFRVARELGTPREQCFHGLTYGWALIAANELEEARTVLSHAAQQNVPQANHQASVALGIACLRAHDYEAAQAAFQEATQRADVLIERSPRYYKGWLTKGLAQAGLSLQQQAPIETAIDSYQRACDIAPHAGVVRRQLRLLEELGEVDSKHALAEVRSLLQQYIQ